MKLIKTKNYEGYYTEDVKKELGKKRFKEFLEWYCGSTGVIHKSKFLIYKWDYDRFLEGLPNLD